MRGIKHPVATGGRPRAFALSVAVTALLLGGCDPAARTAGQLLNPTVASLQEIKGLHTDGNFAAVVDRQVSCMPAQEGCAQLHYLKADSCRRVAGAAGPGRRGRLDCAIENYEAALVAVGQRADPLVDRRAVEIALLDMSVQRRDAAEGAADAAAQNAALQRRAAAAQRGPSARPAGFYHAAEALMSDVVRAGTSGNCARIDEAARLLAEARADGTPYAAPAQRLASSIESTRRARGCAA
ncbi:hypothetical protein [Sabulicella rubraurantiaca]|uniref:hypothetical protein n=1 Tax=Sabulicella rubraurantiaca TaxID=2811429 RepID=UPI001A95C3D7|nr:hypothetical protein [Sabulicella rubraurantiaca]